VAGLNGGARMAATGRARRERTQLRVRVAWSNGSPTNNFDRTGELGERERSSRRVQRTLTRVVISQPQKPDPTVVFFSADVAIFPARE
jgi:hypothetical protein